MLQDIFETIKKDPYNQSYREQGIDPLYVVDTQSKILIIGQAPGIKAQEKMRVFDDLSGQRLMAWLGVDEPTFRNPQNFAIMPMDFYYPGKGKSGDLPPRKEFAAKFHPLLLAEMTELKLIILIGSYAQNYYLKQNRQKNLTETVRAYRQYLPKYFPLVHPSPLNFRWLNKNPWFEAQVIPELQKLVQRFIETND